MFLYIYIYKGKNLIKQVIVYTFDWIMIPSFFPNQCIYLESVDYNENYVKKSLTSYFLRYFLIFITCITTNNIIIIIIILNNSSSITIPFTVTILSSSPSPPPSPPPSSPVLKSPSTRVTCRCGSYCHSVSFTPSSSYLSSLPPPSL